MYPDPAIVDGAGSGFAARLAEPARLHRDRRHYVADRLGGLARVVRGKLLSMRDEDFCVAARLAGISDLKIILRHLIPSMASYIIVALTLSIPRTILGETSLSFLGWSAAADGELGGTAAGRPEPDQHRPSSLDLDAGYLGVRGRAHVQLPR